MLNIAVYCRVSTQEQAEFGYSLNDQERRIKSYIDAFYDENDYKTVVYRDEGISAKSLNRPKIQEMIRKIKTHTINAVYVLSLSRITRRVSDLCELVEMFQEYDVTFVSITENIDTKSSYGRFFLYLLGCLAQLEREEIGERTRRGLEESAKEGNYSKSKIPFGYHRNGKKLEIDEEESKIIQKIFSMLIDEKMSPYSVAVKLRANHVYDRNWTAENIYEIIRNPIYYGTFRYSKSLVLPDHSPSILSYDRWLLAQDSIRSIKDYSKYEYPYKKYAYCDACGKVMTQSSTVKRRRTYLYYFCTTCQKRINQDRIDKVVSEPFENLLKENEYSKKYAALKNKYDDLDNKLKHYSVSLIEHALDKDIYDFVTAETETEKEKLVNEMRSLKTNLAKVSWVTMEYKDKRDFLKNNVDRLKISLDNGNVQICFKKS